MNRLFKYILTTAIFMIAGLCNIKAASPICVYSDSKDNPTWKLTCTVANSDSKPTCSISGENYEYNEQNFVLAATDFINSDNTWGCKETLYADIVTYAFVKHTVSGVSSKQITSRLTHSAIYLLTNESSYGDTIKDSKGRNISKDDIKYCVYDDGTQLVMNHTTKTVSMSNSRCQTFEGKDFNYATLNKLAKDDSEDDCPTQLYYMPMDNGKKCDVSKKWHAGYLKISHDMNGKIEGPDGGDLTKKPGGDSTKKPGGDSTNFNCANAGETIKLIREAYNLLRFLIPVLIIGLSIADFVRVLLNGEEKVFKDAWVKFAKRVAIGVIILILPVILTSLLKLSGALNDYGISSSEYFCIFK